MIEARRDWDFQGLCLEGLQGVGALPQSCQGLGLGALALSTLLLEASAASGPNPEVDRTRDPLNFRCPFSHKELPYSFWGPFKKGP